MAKLKVIIKSNAGECIISGSMSGLTSWCRDLSNIIVLDPVSFKYKNIIFNVKFNDFNDGNIVVDIAYNSDINIESVVNSTQFTKALYSAINEFIEKFNDYTKYEKLTNLPITQYNRWNYENGSFYVSTDDSKNFTYKQIRAIPDETYKIELI